MAKDKLMREWIESVEFEIDKLIYDLKHNSIKSNECLDKVRSLYSCCKILSNVKSGKTILQGKCHK